MLDLVYLRQQNVARQGPNGFNHNKDDWSLSDWLIAAVGELGEACNVVKKLNRWRDKLPQTSKQKSEAELKAQLLDEIADTVIYLDLCAHKLGASLEDAIISKFNRVSDVYSFDIKILLLENERPAYRLTKAILRFSHELKASADIDPKQFSLNFTVPEYHKVISMLEYASGPLVYTFDQGSRTSVATFADVRITKDTD